MWYHGSDTKIDSFSDEFVGAEEATDQEGPGIYLTTALENAEAYGKYIHVVTLNGNELSTTEDDPVDRGKILWMVKHAPDWEMHAMNWNENPGIGAEDATDSIIQYSVNPHDAYQQVWIDFYRREPIAWVKNMVKIGFDYAVKVMPKGNKHAIVFNPAIITLRDIEDRQIEELRNVIRGVLEDEFVEEDHDVFRGRYDYFPDFLDKQANPFFRGAYPARKFRGGPGMGMK